jgi:hypothetical protein
MDASNPLLACADGKNPVPVVRALAFSELAPDVGSPVFERIEAGGYPRIVVNRHRASITGSGRHLKTAPGAVDGLLQRFRAAVRATSRRRSGVNRAARAVPPRLSSSAAALLIYRREFARFNDK